MARGASILPEWRVPCASETVSLAGAASAAVRSLCGVGFPELVVHVGYGGSIMVGIEALHVSGCAEGKFQAVGSLSGVARNGCSGVFRECRRGAAEMA